MQMFLKQGLTTTYSHLHKLNPGEAQNHKGKKRQELNCWSESKKSKEQHKPFEILSCLVVLSLILVFYK